ncbi:ATP-binding protein [Marinibacterium profundimaris]|uniref:ATP-binding protein n=1 Tax=Marinibacterium profundimaris TaxID=1679460 RepID=UPI001303CFF7|nr:adenylate/guanylate cyclase domain-containing protein [Marinibacterium profundimaris]
MSVLFADMVGFTAAVERLGEDATLSFAQMIYQMMTETVAGHGGSVRSYAGDSVMAIFGLPEAQEDGALRACRAALAIHEVFRQAADEIEAQYGIRPQMRAGVSSGSAMLAQIEGEGAPVTAVGNTVNLASRIQTLSPAGGCLICDTTRRQVEWQVDLNFEGEYDIKGLSKSRKLWRLLSIRDAATRFDASVARGLSAYVGRDAERASMVAALDTARAGGFAAVDLAGEAGLGKTRLVFEFLQGIDPEGMRIYRGYCAADGQQVPFYPFLEVMRSAFRVRSEDEPAEQARKLQAGLRQLGMESTENLGLLLNLLGSAPPEGALEGLDGVLIGLRTRDLLRAMLTVQAAAHPVILLIEDIHWIDGASAEFLGRLIEEGEIGNLLIIHTRRPSYVPGWLGSPHLTSLPLKPLSDDDIGHLVRTRLGVENLPRGLVARVSERAGGNPLFGEEILGYLLGHGALRVSDGRAEFDADLAARGLPESMQSLFTARLDRLEPGDKALLQAASVIGRRFDPGLLSAVARPDIPVGEALRRLQAKDLVRREAGSSDYAFKHVLLRDTVYQGLLADQRAALHLAIATVLEHRNRDRLVEVAGALAHHYALTDRSDLAFTYNVLAGTKGLGVYSLGEANQYFETALALYESDPACASDADFAAFLAAYASCANISLRITTLIDLGPQVQPILARLGDSYHHAVYLHHYVSCLIYNGRYIDAFERQQSLTAMAERLGTPEAAAYALVSELSVSCYCGHLTSEAFEARRREAEVAMASVEDAYLQNFFMAILAWNETSRGRFAQAYEAVDRMMVLSETMKDPRATGYAMALKSLIAMLSDDPARALEISDRALALSQAEFERASAQAARAAALVPLKGAAALPEVQSFVDRCEAAGWVMFMSGPHMMQGIAMTMDGRIGDGLHHIQDAIVRRESEGYGISADWYRLFLAEVYLGILTGEGEAPLGVVLRNARSLITVFLFGPGRIERLIGKACANPQFDRNGFYYARGEMILGLLCMHRKKREKAIDHLREARRIVTQIGPSPFLARIDSALETLGARKV